ncbi:MAG: transposase [Acidobacteria bacterium]|nr:transposase [Acidobacteriota bacterium]MBS1866598.1 transposase [Acidobacteriota bacterium]
MPIDRKSTRLPRENYVGHRIYFLTICCDLRRPHLANPNVANRVVNLLRECVASHSFLLHAYCAMPDHLHLLVEGSTPRSDLLNFVRVYKLRTAFEFRKSTNLRLWEMSYHDHVLRRADAVEDVACYIWWNPVRKQMCVTPGEFPFSGSNTIHWMQRSAARPNWSAPWKPKEPI